MHNHNYKVFFINELRLISRNSRFKSMFFGVFFVLPIIAVNLFDYIILVGETNFYLNPLLYLFLLYFTGAFLLSFGINTFNWESTYTNLLFTLPNSLQKLLFTRFCSLFLLNLISTIYYSILFLFIDIEIKIFVLAVSSFLYSSGIGVFFILYASTFNKLYIDLHKDSFLNHDIGTYMSTLFSVLFYFFSYLIFLVINFLTKNSYYTIICFGLIGLFHLIFLSTTTSNLILKNLNLIKHQMLKSHISENLKN